ncbi:MAG: hypothetical protein JWN76_1239 [Chitinophagaceae bacterium]|nr:hypothetical protein [Chitinophagaceae bacterium]
MAFVITGNPKVSVKDYMDTFCVSDRTAVRMRFSDMVALTQKRNIVTTCIRLKDFYELYGYVPLTMASLIRK